MTLSDTSFMKFAKCKEIKDVNFFFAEDLGKVQRAINYCQDCVVKTPCAQYAIDNFIFYGVWGGLSVRSRVKLRREQKQTQTA